MYIYNHVTKNTPCWPIFDITGTSMHSLCTPCNFIRIYKSRYSHMPAVFHTGSWWHHSYGNTTSVYTPLRRDEHCNVNCLSTRNNILGLDSQICSSSLQHTKKWTVMISLLISNALPHGLKQDFRDWPPLLPIRYRSVYFVPRCKLSPRLHIFYFGDITYWLYCFFSMVW